MGEVRLTVPAGSGLDFGQAILAELDDSGDWVKSSKEELERTLMHYPLAADVTGVIRAPARYLMEQVGLIEQLFDGRADNEDGDFEVAADAEVLAHVCETMARKIIPPQIGEVTMVGPMDAESVAELGRVTKALDWAVGEAARLHSIAGAEPRKLEAS